MVFRGFLAAEGDKRTKMQKGIVNAAVYIDAHKVLQSVTDIFGPEISATMSELCKNFRY